MSRAGLITLTTNSPGNFDGSSGNRTVAVTGLEPGFGNGVIAEVAIAMNFEKADG